MIKTLEMQPIFPSACLIVLLLCVGESSQGLENRPVPYALSPVYLQFLENVESQLYRLLKESNKESNQEEVVRNYLRDYENSVRFHKNVSVGSTENVHDKYPVANNPILSMQMINRVTKYFTNDVIASVAKDKGNFTKIYFSSNIPFRVFNFRNFESRIN